MLTGAAGSGKSQLATAVAARCEAEGWPLVAWISAESRGALVSGLSGLGRRLGVDGERQHSPEDSARRCLLKLHIASFRQLQHFLLRHLFYIQRIIRSSCLPIEDRKSVV